MLRWQTLAGVVLGLGAGLAVLNLAGSGRGRTSSPSGPILSECEGHLRELVIHYEPSAKAIVTTVYRDFLGALEKDITVHVVCPSRTAFEDLSAAVGRIRCKLRAVVVGHPMTTWSRDRWVALAPASRKGPTTLWIPRGEAAEEIWPARAGDERVGHDLAAALTSSVCARRSSLYFDGGDFLADGECVFVVPRVLQRNLQQTVQSREELLKVLSAELKCRVVVLEESPDHHAAMFMVAVGQRTMLVGDPSLARELASLKPGSANPTEARVFASLPGGPDFTPETQHLFDAVAAQCGAAGYTVVRIPVVPARDGRTYLTYVNVLQDQQGQQRIVYLPFYRGVDSLNDAARRVWEKLGCQVRLVDCSQTYGHFGCLHCLVNVIKRSP